MKSSSVDVAVLRRPYTRTMPKDIRSVRMLDLSFKDLKLQWKSFLKSVLESPDMEEEMLGRKGCDLAERLLSQIKAIKQELLQHLSTFLHSKPTETDHSRRNLSGLCNADKNSETVSFFTSLSSISGNICSLNCLKAPYLEALCLARRVWLWSIFIAILLADIELLTGSLSFATGLYFALPNSSEMESSPVMGYEGRKVQSFLMSSTSYSGYGALTYDIFRAYVRQQHDRERGPELGDFFDCGKEEKEKNGVEREVKEEKEEEEEWDGMFIHAAVLLYAVLASDAATAAGAVHRWWGALLVESGVTKTTFSEPENAENTLGHMSDFNSKGEASEMGIPLVRSPRGEGETERSRQAKEEEGVRLFAWRVALAAELAAAEDYVALNRLLVCSVALPCLMPQCHSTKSDRLNINSSGVAGEKPGFAFPISACAFFGLQLLYRTLAEHLIRRQCITNDISKCFRPIVSTDMLPFPGEDNNRLKFTFLTDCCVSSPVGIENGEPSHMIEENKIRAVKQSDGWKQANPLFNQMHICSLIQVSSLRSKEGPWPLPKSLVSSAFNF